MTESDIVLGIYEAMLYMNSIQIEIKLDLFSNEWHGSIIFSKDKTEYLASDDLEELINIIKQKVLEQRHYEK